ncbi:MAG: hypothetical protein ACTHWA_04685 [Arachnia sp.]
MDETTTTPQDFNELTSDLLLLLEDTLLHIDELQHVGSDTAEIVELRAYAASLRGKL